MSTVAETMFAPESAEAGIIADFLLAYAVLGDVENAAYLVMASAITENDSADLVQVIFATVGNTITRYLDALMEDVLANGV